MEKSSVTLGKPDRMLKVLWSSVNRLLEKYIRKFQDTKKSTNFEVSTKLNVAHA